MSSKKTGTSFILFVAVVLLGIGMYFFWNRPPVSSEVQNANENVNETLPEGVGGADTEEGLNEDEAEEVLEDAGVNRNLNANLANTNAVGDDKKLVNETYGFLLNLPDGWIAKEQAGGEIYSIDFSDGSTMSVLSADEEELVRDSFTIIIERSVLVRGTAATRISATSLKDGSAVEVLFVPDDPYVYHFRGTGVFIDMIQEQFSLN
ncbi:MAG: hypothetical protein AAB733_03035 [Patescibacteria group bacterium]